MGWSPAEFWASRQAKKADRRPSPRQAPPPASSWTPPPTLTLLYPATPAPHSSWVSNYAYAMKEDGTCGLAVQFRSGDVIFYPDATESEYLNFDTSVSKGKWIHDNVYTRRYEKM